MHPTPNIQSHILHWYKANGRHDLPWRNLDTLGIDVPYGVLVSEIMLQQTQVDRVVPKFRAFIDYYPTVQKLAAARPAQVVTLWSGLGYNRRAILLHKAAGVIVDMYKGKIPADYDELNALPAIGPYTAAAILAFGYNQPVAVLDTNILRFYELLFWGHNRPKQKEMEAFALQFVPHDKSREWHSALMDLMSIARTKKSPLDQQLWLLHALQLTPTWPLPKLDDRALKRPKQTKFTHSPRYYRGKIVAHLRDRPNHSATLGQIRKMVTSLNMPATYNLEGILDSLKRDGIIIFHEPLRPRSRISLP
jgi:A/G-specific adenine glycosylase